MWAKKFLTPEVWEKIIISTKSRIHASPTNVQWSCQPFWGLGKKRIWHLSKCHPSMKWLARVVMLWFSRLKFCISRLKKRRWKIQMKREIQWNAQFPFCGQTKAFRYEVVFRGIEPRFYTADRSAWFVFNQPRQRGFWRNLRYILYFMVKESAFLKGNFCIYKGFMEDFYIFTSAWMKNHKMCILNWLFAICSAYLTCVNGSTIQFLLRKLLFRINLWVF